MATSCGSISGFHHVAFRAPQFDATVAFYTQGLGCREALAWGEAPGRAVMLDVGDGAFLELFEGGADGAKPEGALLHFALKTDDCDASYQRALAAGATGTVAPQNVSVASTPRPFAVRLAFCTGLAGETIEFFQQLA